MPKFINALKNWNTEQFSQTLKHEIEALEPGSLPLYKGLTQGGQVDDDNITATVMSTIDDENVIQAKVGVFFTEIVGGCSCGDDPMSQNVYCEMQFRIDKTTADTEINVFLD